MFKSLFPLAVQGTLSKKRSSILVFTVLLLSFAFAIVTLSLTASISDTNAAYRCDTYGAWYFAIPGGKDGDKEWLESQSWADTVASVTVYTYMDNALGTVDEAYLTLGHIDIDGRLPETSGEVAMTKSALKSCGVTDYTLGETVTIKTYAYTCRAGATVDPLRSNEKKDGEALEYSYTYTLVGVLDDYQDLWSFFTNRAQMPFVEILVTEETAQTLCTKMNALLRNEQLFPPVAQYFVGVAEANRETAAAQTAEYLRTTRDATYEDWQPGINYRAYSESSMAVAADTLYMYLIAAVALVAVLCVYMMGLPAEVHSFAVLRSIGITKAQLLVLMLEESLLLTLPAMLLGLPLGMLLTKLSLRLLLYAGSVPVQVTVPYDALLMLLPLWLGVIVASRLVIFLVTVRTPLTGGMQLRENKARASRRFRRALIALLLAAFGAAAMYTAAESSEPSYFIGYYNSMPYYIITGGKSGVPTEMVELIERVPGVVRAEGNSVPRSVAFNCGAVSSNATLLEYDVRRVAEATGLEGEALEVFTRGELVLLYALDDAALPVSDTLHLRIEQGGECLTERVSSAQIGRADATARSGLNLSFGGDISYAVVCSAAYYEALLESIPQGAHWAAYGTYQSGSFGYDKIEVRTDSNAVALGTASVVEALVKSKLTSGGMLDTTDVYETYRQESTQTLILLLACGGCIALITLLLLASALALETEQERRSYTILRVIGMSLRQMRKKIFGKALWRSVLAVLSGWALYGALVIVSNEELSALPALRDQWGYLESYGFTGPVALILSAAMLCATLAVSLLAKRGLKQTTLLK